MANVAPTSRPDVSFPVLDGSAAPETISGGHLVAKAQPSLINVWIDLDAFAPGTMNQTMYK